MSKQSKLILKFSETNIKDISLVGGKNASLGEMYQNLTKKGINIPNGFSITAEAYRYFLSQSEVDKKIKSILKDLNTKDIANLEERGQKTREAILAAEFPSDLKAEIIDVYKAMFANTSVAVRSSATAEDLPDASFAGQQETYLNIKGEYTLLEAVKKCFSSLFTNRAISYREDKGFDHFKIALSVGVQKMVRSDLSCSGVMFTLHPETGFRDIIVIQSSYGLGENIVKGQVNPDEYIVFKPTLKQGYRPIISKKIGAKEIKMIYSSEGNQSTKNVPTPAEDQKRLVLSDDEILQLAKWGMMVEEHYKKPMDLEWAKDGVENKLYIVQARPETVESQKNPYILEEYILKETGKVIVTGASVGAKIGQGKARIIKNVQELKNFQKGEVLVADITDPDWEPVMKIAKAIVTNKGGTTSHAAIVSRELGIPCIVGTHSATQLIRDGKEVTVCCAQGSEGKVYGGLLGFEIKRTNLKELKKSKTKIMMNVGDPDQAFNFASIPNDGVGLARLEFIITGAIKIHPLALLYMDEGLSLNQGGKIGIMISPDEARQIEELSYNYNKKSNFYIEKLAEGIAKIAAAFYPKDVIVRTSDFKSNEYASLLGGKLFEPKEENPMIGWRGASRYYDPKFKAAFGLECLALKRVREEFGLNNVKVMIPFCRTIEEGKKVIQIMEEFGLKRDQNDIKNKLEIYVMCEIPSNIILADEFAKIFDGFSIGSNDLTQLTLGVDRDSELVSHVYDERNEAVKNLLRNVIKAAKKNNVKIGICGQGPSDHEDFAEFLAREGIDSMSLNPDTVLKTTQKIAEMKI